MSKLKLRKLIKYIYEQVKGVYEKIKERIGVVNETDLLPESVKKEDGRYVLRIGQWQDIWLASAIIRVKRVALMLGFGDGELVNSEFIANSSIELQMQLYIPLGPSSSYAKIVEGLYPELKVVRVSSEEAGKKRAASNKAVACYNKCERLWKKAAKARKPEAQQKMLESEKLMLPLKLEATEAEEKKRQDRAVADKELLNKKRYEEIVGGVFRVIDGKEDRKQIRNLVLVWAVAESVRDPAMLIFFWMVLDNLKNGEFTFEDAIAAHGIDAYTPSQENVSRLLNQLCEAKDSDAAYTLLQAHENCVYKKQMKRQIVRYFDRRAATVGVQEVQFTARTDKAKLKLFADCDEAIADRAACDKIDEILHQMQPSDHDLSYSQADLELFLARCEERKEKTLALLKSP